MKFILNFSIVAAGILLLFANCSKPKDYSTDYLKGNINGVAFECNNIKANTPMPGPSGSGGGNDPTIIITGEWPMYTLKLNIYGEGSSIATGTYVFQADKHRSATIWYNSVDAYYAGPSGGGFSGLPLSLTGTGKITILEINKKYIKGSFEFVTAVSGVPGLSKTVTGGEFHIKRS
jgi:hypothetical protein